MSLYPALSQTKASNEPYMDNALTVVTTRREAPATNTGNGDTNDEADTVGAGRFIQRKS